MSIVKVRAALETQLAAMVPQLDTAWENAAFQSTAGVPYQRVNLMAAAPDNPTFGDAFYRELGYLQVTLCYPLQAGPAAAAARAELLRATFPRGMSMVKDGVTVTVQTTPEIVPAIVDGDRYCIPVRIRYFANIQP
jgi:hypothetical protein